MGGDAVAISVVPRAGLDTVLFAAGAVNAIGVVIGVVVVIIRVAVAIGVDDVRFQAVGDAVAIGVGYAFYDVVDTVVVIVWIDIVGQAVAVAVDSNYNNYLIIFHLTIGGRAAGG